VAIVVVVKRDGRRIDPRMCTEVEHMVLVGFHGAVAALTAID
jgi:hypothetical protein